MFKSDFPVILMYLNTQPPFAGYCYVNLSQTWIIWNYESSTEKMLPSDGPVANFLDE